MALKKTNKRKTEYKPYLSATLMIPWVCLHCIYEEQWTLWGSSWWSSLTSVWVCSNDKRDGGRQKERLPSSSARSRGNSFVALLRARSIVLVNVDSICFHLDYSHVLKLQKQWREQASVCVHAYHQVTFQHSRWLHLRQHSEQRAAVTGNKNKRASSASTANGAAYML